MTVKLPPPSPDQPALMPIYDDMRECLRQSQNVENSINIIESSLGAALPGDTHVNPNPFAGMDLSKNPHSKISPQTMPATIERPYDSQCGQVYKNDGNKRHQNRHSESLRKLVDVKDPK